ncbi:MAG: hypothetical protein HS103_06525 [Anaerolineales bacterium]|nr:hypothetical protein [Anaerolineales bacterium]
MKQRFGTAFWLTMILLTVAGIVVIYLNGRRLTPSSYLAPAQGTIDPTRAIRLITLTVFYGTVGTPMPTARPSNTFTLGQHLTAEHFQKTRYWDYVHSWLTNDAKSTQRYFNTQTALALTATPTPSPSKTATATPTRTPTPTATPFPAIIPYPTGFPPVCPGGGGEWMWVDGELIFVCGVSWE